LFVFDFDKACASCGSREENKKSHETDAEFPAMVKIARVVVPDFLVL
jgi:hypothetical protein